jgi:hypothetical protein
VLDLRVGERAPCCVPTGPAASRGPASRARPASLRFAAALRHHWRCPLRIPASRGAGGRSLGLQPPSLPPARLLHAAAAHPDQEPRRPLAGLHLDALVLIHAAAAADAGEALPLLRWSPGPLRDRGRGARAITVCRGPLVRRRGLRAVRRAACVRGMRRAMGGFLADGGEAAGRKRRDGRKQERRESCAAHAPNSRCERAAHRRHSTGRSSRCFCISYATHRPAADQCELAGCAHKRPQAATPVQGRSAAAHLSVGRLQWACRLREAACKFTNMFS